MWETQKKTTQITQFNTSSHSTLIIFMYRLVKNPVFKSMPCRKLYSPSKSQSDHLSGSEWSRILEQVKGSIQYIYILQKLKCMLFPHKLSFSCSKQGSFYAFQIVKYDAFRMLSQMFGNLHFHIEDISSGLHSRCVCISVIL